MKIAVVGSRDIGSLCYELLCEKIPAGCSEIVTGGAKGVDTLALLYAKKHHLKTKVFLPDYAQSGRSAPILRNLQIIEYSDCVLAFWDGKSPGTAFVISECYKCRKPVKVYLI